jgi:valyl-tRNA synthetase
MALAKTYNPSEIETKWYDFWEQSEYFKPSGDTKAPSYCIFLPPPNVTGTLHMGHGFQHTLMDILIRNYRMKGYNTLWQPGTDHGGIATQMVVERQLAQNNLTRHDLGREQFIDKVWQWKNQSGSTITKQMRRLGASCDWSKERFTMDEGLSEAVSEVFIELYNQGYIYKGKRLVNWDIKLQTAISDLEVESCEEQGSLWSINYYLENSNEFITVATTRPETILGDVAVAVNPADERHKHLIGKKVIIPIINKSVTIIGDDFVDLEFGTGFVKITPGHDFNDYEVGVRHSLPIINIMNLDGTLNTNVPAEYQGLDRFKAREKILEQLKHDNVLVNVKPHKLMVPRGEKSNEIIEPLLTDQWYVKTEELARNALDLVESGQIRFVPDNWIVIYRQWLENIKDWCISRQLWWGHRIPAFYDKKGNCFVAKDIAAAAILAGTTELNQDTDVLDTWFSSALWPFSTLGWPDQTADLDTFLPSNVLVTGFDIIFFWVARMVMFTHHFTHKIPFKDVYVHGLIQDARGIKMSKTKGNVIDPLDLVNGISLEDLVTKRTHSLINKKLTDTIIKQTTKDYPQGFDAYGADALRFAFASIATHGREIRFDIRKIQEAQNFCNKLFNATKFLLMNIEEDKTVVVDSNDLSFIDFWILNEFKQLINELEMAYQTYRFDILAQKIYEFIWNEFCDWYIELAKVNLKNENIKVKQATLGTLFKVLEGCLRLIHPIMPFISEELWQNVAPICNKKNTDSIMIASYPNVNEFGVQDQSYNLNDIKLLKELIGGIRNLRSEMNINPGVKVPLIIEANATNKTTIDNLHPYLLSLGKLTEIEIKEQLVSDNAPIMIISGIKIMLYIKLDVAAEKVRLNKEIEKFTKELDKINLKLTNPSFLERAPSEVVKKDSLRVEQLKETIMNLNQQLSYISK